MSTYIVTGGTGFVGKELTAHLRGRGHTVIVASRSRPLAGDAHDWIEFDLRDSESAYNIVNARPDGVFHLAWSSTPAIAEHSPASDISVNLAGTINLLSQLASAGNIRVVLVSSGGTIYGDVGLGPISEDQAPNPISIYGITKLAMEAYATRSRLFTELDVRIGRVANPFGAGQAHTKMQGAATIFARKILNGERIQIWGDGAYVRDYIHIADVVAGLAAVMDVDRQRLPHPAIFNIGSGQGLSLLQLIQYLEAGASGKAQIQFEPSRNFDVPYNVLDISRLSNLTGWTPGDVGERLQLLIKELRRQ